MKKIISITLLLIFFTNLQSFAQIPAKAQKNPIIIKNGTIHVGNGQIIENGVLVFDKGKITYIGKEAQNIADAKVIDAAGKKVYPGLILTISRIGLSEIEAVRATIDDAEVGDFNPNVRALVAYNTDSEIIPTLKDNGILTIHASPRGGTLSGMSAIMHADGWNWEDAVLKADDGIFFNFPPLYSMSGWWAEGLSFEADKKRAEKMEKLNLFFSDALAYSKNPAPTHKNLKFEAMRGLFDASKTLFINAHYAKDMMEAVVFARKYEVKKIVIWGGAEAGLITDFLKSENVSVAIERVFDLPHRNDDDVATAFKLPSVLQNAGVNYCITFAGDSEPMNARNLPFSAGYAAAYGLTKEQALSAITLNAAKILGVDSQIGSLEVGKLANIVISEGDILDMRTNKISQAFIEGRDIDLDNRQKQLYRKFKDKNK